MRRQFDERPGIMTREEKPDYSRCVALVTQASLKEVSHVPVHEVRDLNC